jgi:putative endonuclease
VWQRLTRRLLQPFVDHHGEKYAPEFHDTMEAAICREKRIKHWRRAWKPELIERDNPEWEDIYPVSVPGLDPRASGGDE